MVSSISSCSEIAPATADVMARLVPKYLDPVSYPPSLVEAYARVFKVESLLVCRPVSGWCWGELLRRPHSWRRGSTTSSTPAALRWARLWGRSRCKTRMSLGNSHSRAAANKHLTPCTLELGGKSPTYIDDTGNLEVIRIRRSRG